MRLFIRQPNAPSGFPALLGRLQSNIGLKLISLFLSLLLYFYVQAEHNMNPQITVPLRATVQVHNVPNDVICDATALHPLVRVTGPRILVENMRDGDVVADVDLAGQSSNTHVAIVPARYTVPTLKPDVMEQIHIEGPVTLHIQLYARITRVLPVHAVLPPPPLGYTYQSLQVVPAHAEVSGREDYVDAVARLNVYPTLLADGVVRGDFAIQAVNKQGVTVTDVDISPPTAHVTAYLVSEPSFQIAVVSPQVASLPTPPYRVERIEALPSQVELKGLPTILGRLSVVSTEPIELQSLTTDATLEAKLVLPDGVKAYNLQGKPLSRVKIYVSIVREAALTPSHPSTSSPNSGETPSPPQTGGE